MTQNILGLLQSVLTLDGLHPSAGHLRLGAINIQRRQRAQFQRTLVMLVCGFSGIQRLLRHFQVATRLHHIPILVDDQLNGVTNLDFKHCARPQQIPARDDKRRAICEQPAVAQERLGELEAERGRIGGIEEVESAV